MNKLICILLLISNASSWAAVSKVENVKCFNTSVASKYNTEDKEDKLDQTDIYKSVVTAQRTKTMDNDVEVYVTVGTVRDHSGTFLSSYKSERRTHRINLDADNYREVSTVVTYDTTPDSKTQAKIYNSELTYEIQADGTKKLTKKIIDVQKVLNFCCRDIPQKQSEVRFFAFGYFF